MRVRRHGGNTKRNICAACKACKEVYHLPAENNIVDNAVNFCNTNFCDTSGQKSDHREYIVVEEMTKHEANDRKQEYKSPKDLTKYMHYIFKPKQKKVTRRFLAHGSWMGMGGNADDYGKAEFTWVPNP